MPEAVGRWVKRALGAPAHRFGVPGTGAPTARVLLRAHHCSFVQVQEGRAEMAPG